MGHGPGGTSSVFLFFSLLFFRGRRLRALRALPPPRRRRIVERGPGVGDGGPFPPTRVSFLGVHRPLSGSLFFFNGLAAGGCRGAGRPGRGLPSFPSRFGLFPNPGVGGGEGGGGGGGQADRGIFRRGGPGRARHRVFLRMGHTGGPVRKMCRCAGPQKHGGFTPGPLKRGSGGAAKGKGLSKAEGGGGGDKRRWRGDLGGT